MSSIFGMVAKYLFPQGCVQKVDQIHQSMVREHATTSIRPTDILNVLHRKEGMYLIRAT